MQHSSTVWLSAVNHSGKLLAVVAGATVGQIIFAAFVVVGVPVAIVVLVC